MKKGDLVYYFPRKTLGVFPSRIIEIKKSKKGIEWFYIEILVDNFGKPFSEETNTVRRVKVNRLWPIKYSKYLKELEKKGKVKIFENKERL